MPQRRTEHPYPALHETNLALPTFTFLTVRMFHPGFPQVVTRSGGSIHDLRAYHLNDQTRSLKINSNDCG